MLVELVQFEGRSGDRMSEPERDAQPVAVKSMQAIRVLREIQP